MRRNRLLAILFATFGLLGLTIPFSLSAVAAPQVQVCQTLGNDCLNRAGGATSFGTHVIAYTENDNNNDFAFGDENLSYCGGTNWVHNGENGLVCPFTNGSGLNARYDHKFIFRLHAYHEINTCAVVSNNTFGNVTLNSCGSNGYLWVGSPNGNGDYLINVGMSNAQYASTGITNRPFWLFRVGHAVQLIAKNDNSNDGPILWSCVGHGVDACV